MKSYSKGILVGISIVVGSLLLMGSTNYTKEVNNKFELHLNNEIDDTYLKGFLLNTETGETWYLKDKKKYKSTIEE